MTAKKIILFALLLSLAAASSAFAKDRVAVLDFEAKDVEESDALAVADLFRSDLVAVGTFIVLERGNMKSILAEHELQMSGMMNEASASEIGELLSVNYLFLGNLSKFGNKFIMVIDKINVETGEIENSVKKTAVNMDSFLELSAEAAVELSGEAAATIAAANDDIYDANTITELIAQVGIFNLFGITDLEINNVKMQATDQEVRREIYNEFALDNAMISMFMNAATLGIWGSFNQGFVEYAYLSIGTAGLFVISLFGNSLGAQILTGTLLLASYGGSFVTPWLYESEYNQYLKDSLFVY